MMLAARGAFLAARRKPRLPYDAEVEWLRMIDSTSFVDTGLIAGSDISFEAKCKRGTGYGNSSFGAGRNPPVQRYHVDFYEGLDLYYGTSNTLYKITNSSWQDPFVVRILPEEKKAFFNSQLITIPDTQFTVTDGRFLIGTRTWNGKTQINSVDTYFYYVKMWKSGSLVRDMIPVRFTNELGQREGAMYDRANPTVGMNPDGSARTDGLYRNRGTGAFVIGADKTA